MAYLPKSKIQILDTSGGEFIYKSSRKPYKGPYIETSEGKYYEGSNSLNLNIELVKLV